MSTKFCELMDSSFSLWNIELLFTLHCRYNAFLSLGVLSPEGEIVGAACFLNYPNINAVPPWCWLQWMRNLFGCESVTQRNSIWIQLLLWKPKFASVFLKPILQYFFSKQKYKAYVLVAIPPGVKSINFLGDNASRILPRGKL